MSKCMHIAVRSAGWIVVAAILPLMVGCASPAARARIARENDNLRQRNAKLERTIGECDATVAQWQQQVENLQKFDAQRPVAAFAPVKIEIASFSGAGDFDGQPGSDGVTVHLRLLDADGDAVKVPGRVKIQITDNHTMGAPRVLAVHNFETLEQLRAAWHGRFGTQHFTFRCPFPEGVPPPTGTTVDVRAEFTDYLTGVPLTTVKEIAWASAKKPSP